MKDSAWKFFGIQHPSGFKRRCLDITTVRGRRKCTAPISVDSFPYGGGAGGQTVWNRMQQPFRMTEWDKLRCRKILQTVFSISTTPALAGASAAAAGTRERPSAWRPDRPSGWSNSTPVLWSFGLIAILIFCFPAEKTSFFGGGAKSDERRKRILRNNYYSPLRVFRPPFDPLNVLWISPKMAGRWKMKSLDAP